MSRIMASWTKAACERVRFSKCRRQARTELLVSTDCDATDRDDKTLPVTKIGIIEQNARVGRSFLQALQILGRHIELRGQSGPMWPANLVSIAAAPADVDPHIAAVGSTQLLQPSHKRRDMGLRFRIALGLVSQVMPLRRASGRRWALVAGASTLAASLVLAMLWSLPRLPLPQEQSKLDCGKLYKNFWQ